MSTANTAICPSRTLFHPLPKEHTNWNFDDTLKASQMSARLSLWGLCCQIISTVGGMIAAYKFAKILFFGAALLPSTALFTITAVGVFCLSMRLNKIAAQHLDGLTQEKIGKLTDEALIEGLKNLSYDPLGTAGRDKDAEKKAVAKANSLEYIAEPLYFGGSTLEPPTFLIHDKKMSDERRQKLLEIALSKGIILHFKSLAMVGEVDGESKPGEHALEVMHRACEIASRFINRCFVHHSLKHGPERLNAQLNALGVKCKTKEGIKILKPNFQFTNFVALTINVNCSEVHSLLDIIALHHVWIYNIHIRFNGVNHLQVSQTIQNETRSYDFGKPEDLSRFQADLEKLYKGKVGLCREDRTYDMWQAGRWDLVIKKDHVEMKQR